MKQFAGLAGHEDIIRSLRRAVTDGRVAHAYLFAGPAGTGKTTAARALAAALLCRQPRDGEACGACRDCRQMAAGSHPDLHLIVPEGASIKIGQVREMQRAATLYPVQGRRQVYLIRDADLMTAGAANALLKTLEEPPAGVVFILTSVRPYALLPTVVSRCQDYFFRVLPLPLVMAVVQRETGLDPEAAALVAALSGGSPGRALELAAGGEPLEQRARALALAAALPGAGAAVACRQAAALAAEKGTAAAFLEILLVWYRDLLLWLETSSGELLVNRDCQAQVRREAARFTSGRLIQMLGQIERTRRLLTAGVNTRLALEVLFLQLAETA
ncbi:DNA polymerase III subunit delta' [Desulfotomaculum copahuensis]|uniref:DNA polymerase III subunit delta' n=1 Tax=Desulfotomaculum copahuensis TaxID=1838280 RepID=A0A1B7LI88_9FIRM|nr:DNA polymerase III subunit delta' [Desulfotomaculum copahuensis]OAT86122.1 DNA polymerase III subunit delta' [Desulfotomaculum copahuensis]